MTLLVATQNPNAVAETYVRQHMRSIAPGRTVGLGFAINDTVPTDLPFLSVGLPKASLLRKLYLLQGRWRHGFAGAPLGDQRRSIINFVRTHGVRAVLAEFGPTGAAMREICQTEGIPLVVNFHGYDATVMPKRAEVRAAYAKLARDAAGFVCGSQHFRETVGALGFPREKIVVIPCGVNPALFTASPDRKGCRLVAVGRLTEKKAPLKTLEAFVEARRAFPSLRLDILGDGPMMPACHDFVKRYALQACVVLHGACKPEEVRRILAEADVFVQHSVVAPNGDTESQGISLVEAMASALPVVTTDHNGFSETVVDGETGYLVAEGDVSTMAQHTITLLENPDLRRRMGEAGKARARRHFDEVMLSGRLYKHLSQFADF